MSQYLVDQVGETPNIRVWHNTNVVEAIGGDHLEALRIAHSDTGDDETVPAQGLFIFIGAKPYTDWISDLIAIDQQSYVLTGVDLDKTRDSSKRWPLKRDPYWLEASVPGVFVAGDVRHRSMKRIASATGEGAMAIHFIHQYLGGL
jgi:thioredoxin reductase (NADPH)